MYNGNAEKPLSTRKNDAGDDDESSEMTSFNKSHEQ